MGAVFSACSGARLACCLGSAACNLCCRCCPKSKSSTVTRIVYAAILLLGAIVSWVMLSDWASSQLAKIPSLVDSFLQSHCITTGGCSINAMVGIMGVYRVCFTLAIFFTLIGLLTYGVKSTKDSRAGIQNGWWLPKTIALLGLLIGSFFMPNEFFFDFQYIGLIGAFLFILVQLVLLVDFAHAWCERWVMKWEDTERGIYRVGLFGSTLALYIVMLILYIVLFVYFAQGDGCSLNKFFVSFNLLLCMAASVASVLPVVQQANSKSGLLQSAVVSVYVAYLTFSAVSNEPSSSCQTSVSEDAANGTSQALGAILTFVAVAYSSVRSAGQISSQERAVNDAEVALLDSDTLSKLQKEGDEEEEDDDDDDENRERKSRKVRDDEKDGVAYSYTAFNLIFALASLYLMELITNWATVNNGSESSVNLGHSWSSVWVKMASSWAALLIYIWSLIAPLVLVNREFSY